MDNQYLPITAEVCGSFSDYFGAANYDACDYSVGCTFIWKDYFQYEYRVTGGFLILRGMREGYPFYLCPVGEGDFTAVVAELKKETLAQNLPLIFAAVPESRLPELSKDAQYFNVISERDWCDYVYSAEDLMLFQGKKYHGQKNQLNNFYKNEAVEFYWITAENTCRVKRFLEHLDVKENEREEVRTYETARVKELLDNFVTLKQLGCFLTVNGKIVAFSVGEVVGKTLVVHVEKADRDFRGAYTAVCNAFVKAVNEKFPLAYVNREDDLGMEGLRKAKTDLHPVKLVEKPNIVLSERQEVLQEWGKLSELCEL